MNLRSVSVSASVGLVEQFFTSLNKGSNHPEALHHPREMIRKEYDYPFFQASFVLAGEMK